MLESVGMMIQLTLLTLACWFSSATLFGSLDAGAEETTKMVSLSSIISFAAFGYLFLVSALSPRKE